MIKLIALVPFVLFSSSQNYCFWERPLNKNSVVIENVFLENEEWRIVEMATAHGIFTIEIEIANSEDSKRLARALVAPLKNQYSEVLIYFYQMGSDEVLPVLRVQWNRETGFVEMFYQ